MRRAISGGNLLGGADTGALCIWATEDSQRITAARQPMIVAVQKAFLEASEAQGLEDVLIKKSLVGVPAVTLIHDADHCICLRIIASFVS
jgi:hypothetical protein